MEPQIPAGRTRETKIRRDRSGRWWNDDDPIDHPNLVRAFNAWVDVAEDGRFCLKNDINWAYVSIEGAPLFVRSARVAEGRVRLSLSDGRQEELDPATLRQDAEGALYCTARGGTMAARFDKAATMELEALIGEDGEGVFVTVGGKKHRPPVVQEPVAVSS